MPARASSAARRTLAGLLGLLLLIGGLSLVVPAVAAADTLPADPAAPDTVTADPLPTVQINGVAWSQVVVGDKVYVAGSFTSARPAGAAAGVNETPRLNLLAYDIRTGQLDTSFAPSLNAQALTVTASPDGSRIYVGGDFTTANGQPRARIAAYSTATGQLVPDFRPAVQGQVRAIAASSTTVYFGGSVTAVGNASRSRLAAVSAVNGALLPWAPVPGVGSTAGNHNTAVPATNSRTSNEVRAMVLAGPNGQVVVAGHFDSLNGVKATGVGALDGVTAAVRPFAINQIITNQGYNSAVWSLSTDGNTVYGTGYDWGGPGNLEATFAASANGGAPVWIADCRGDTYSAFAVNGVVYTASHAHDCANVGAWQDQGIPAAYQYANAFTVKATQVNQQFSALRSNTNFVGRAAPTRLSWSPTFYAGKYTGQMQAGWSITGTPDYIAYGGEFPGVNGSNQQGLVRFAVRSLAPNKVAPRAGTNGFAPLVTTQAGTVRIAWNTAYDRDDQVLTYRVYRDGDTTTPVCSAVRPSEWWSMPLASCDDSTAPAGAHTYQVVAGDPTGNKLATAWQSVTVPASSSGAPFRAYSAAVAQDGATRYWPLDETAGYALDHGGVYDGTVRAGVTRGQGGAIAGDADPSFAFNGSSTAAVTTSGNVTAPQTFSVEAWFQTTSTAGGRIVGFGSENAVYSPMSDRHLFMTPSGQLSFGVVLLNGTRSVTSPARLNDGRWHHAVGTLGSQGLSLYVDGVLVGTRADTTSARVYNGWWRIGADGYWTGVNALNGRIDEVAVYPTALSAGQVAAHRALGTTGVAPNQAPVAAFTSTVKNQTVAFDASGSVDRDGTIAAYSWAFGDGTAGSGRTASHEYASAGTWTATLTVTDDKGASTTVSRTVTTTVNPPNVAPKPAFTSTASGRTVAFDGGSSTDGDGTVASYTWSFGDGTTGTGTTASHSYAADGTYTVTLTATDDDGAAASVSRDVTVTGQVLATDAFQRSVTGGLGTADVGGPWAASAGATRLSVTPGTATLRLDTANQNTGAYLAGVSSTATQVDTAFALSAAPTGNGTYVYVTGRRVATGSEYRVRVRVMADGRVGLAVSRLAGGTETFPGGEVVVPGLTWTAGTTLNVRLQVTGTGTTTVAATVWAQGSAMPAVASMTRTDTTAALQAVGGVALAAHRPSGTTAAVDVRFTSFRVTPVG
jgi:PKD repeat protein